MLKCDHDKYHSNRYTPTNPANTFICGDKFIRPSVPTSGIEGPPSVWPFPVNATVPLAFFEPTECLATADFRFLMFARVSNAIISQGEKDQHTLDLHPVSFLIPLYLSRKRMSAFDKRLTSVNILQQ